jgi:hypothetical protein
MDLFGLTSDRVMARIHQNGAGSSIPSFDRSLLIGSRHNLPRPQKLARASRLLPKNGRAAMLNAHGAGRLSQIPNNADEDRRKRQ